LRKTVVSLVVIGAVLVAGALVQAAPSHKPLPAGWAPGGTASNPPSQVKHDTTCGPNSVLLFSARGSGDKYGAGFADNRIGQWTQFAGNVLGHRGWSVRDLQAIYPAPGVPSFAKLAAAVLAGGPAGAALVLKDYRDAPAKSWHSVRGELKAAYRRCPSRPILLAGYSQGAILFRYVVPRLPSTILHKIISVDLIADPTEQAAVDVGLQHPANLDGLLTGDGIDTWAGAALHVGTGFLQMSYPRTMQERVYQYCVTNDLVCNLTVANLDPTNVAVEGKTHASYGFGAIGVAAAERLGSYGVAAFRGNWLGHTRELTISRSGQAKEMISIGCCDLVLRMRLQLSNIRGSSEKGSARMRVTSVHVHDWSAFSTSFRPPRVGDGGTLRLRYGIITEPLTRDIYCDYKQQASGKCGA
jgi:Cutinase